MQQAEAEFRAAREVKVSMVDEGGERYWEFTNATESVRYEEESPALERMQTERAAVVAKLLRVA